MPYIEMVTLIYSIFEMERPVFDEEHRKGQRGSILKNIGLSRFDLLFGKMALWAYAATGSYID
jgi:hypothetical protein